MKFPLYFSLLFLIISLTSCEGCEGCDDDIVVTGFQLTDVSKSFLPEMPMDTLIYTNDSIEIELHTIDGKVLEDTITFLIPICNTPFGLEQFEVAETEVQHIKYYSDGGSFVFEYGVEIRETTKDDPIELDSLNIYESFFININEDKDSYIEGLWSIWLPVNDIQNEYTIAPNGNSEIILDTILNGVSYSDVITNRNERNVFYSKTKGLIAFNYLEDTWYLKGE